MEEEVVLVVEPWAPLHLKKCSHASVLNFYHQHVLELMFCSFFAFFLFSIDLQARKKSICTSKVSQEIKATLDNSYYYPSIEVFIYLVRIN